METKAVATALCDFMFARLEYESALMFSTLVCKAWPTFEVPSRYQNWLHNSKDNEHLALAIYEEKETVMQIKDKARMRSVNEAVSLTAHRIGLASSLLFESKVIDLIECVQNYRNVLLVGKSGHGKTTLLKSATDALLEMGLRVDKQQIYINSYTNEQLFGPIASSKARYILLL